jgi:hypothetical protein
MTFMVASSGDADFIFLAPFAGIIYEAPLGAVLGAVRRAERWETRWEQPVR